MLVTVLNYGPGREGLWASTVIVPHTIRPILATRWRWVTRITSRRLLLWGKQGPSAMARGFLDFWEDLKVLRDKSLPGIEPQFFSCLARELINMPEHNIALNVKEWFPWVLKLAYRSIDWARRRSFLLAMTNSCVILWRCSYSYCNHSYAFFAQFVCNGLLDLRRRPCLIVRPRVLSWKPLQISMKFDINVMSFKAVPNPLIS